MELKELNDDERIALVTLLEMIVASDGGVTREELSHIKHVIHGLGEHAYRAAVAAADERFADDDTARRFLLGIAREPARELIFETALEAAMADGIAVSESEILTWVGKSWRLPLRFERGDTES